MSLISLIRHIPSASSLSVQEVQAVTSLTHGLCWISLKKGILLSGEYNTKEWQTSGKTSISQLCKSDCWTNYTHRVWQQSRLTLTSNISLCSVATFMPLTEVHSQESVYPTKHVHPSGAVTIPKQMVCKATPTRRHKKLLSSSIPFLCISTAMVP